MIKNINLESHIAFLKDNRLIEEIPSPYTFDEFDLFEDAGDARMFGLNGRLNSLCFTPLILECITQVDFYSYAINEERHVNLAFERLCDKIIVVAKEYYRSKSYKQNKLYDLSKAKEVKELCDKIEYFEIGIGVIPLNGKIASMSKWHEDKESYIILIDPNYLDDLVDLKPAIMHELTHLVDLLGSREFVSLYGNDIDDIDSEFLYVFSPKEINARMTEVFYALKEKNYTKEDFQKVLKGLELRVKDFEERRNLAIYYIQTKGNLSSGNAASLPENYWSLVTLFDKMIYHIYRIENMDSDSRNIFVKRIIEISKRHKDTRQKYVLANIPERDLVKDYFSISENTSTERAIKNILTKCNIILKRYIKKLKNIFDDLESASNKGLLL